MSMSTGSRSHERRGNRRRPLPYAAELCFEAGSMSRVARRGAPRPGELQEWARNIETTERWGEAFWDGPNSAKLST
jgi:hypothetical protein